MLIHTPSESMHTYLILGLISAAYETPLMPMPGHANSILVTRPQDVHLTAYTSATGTSFSLALLDTNNFFASLFQIGFLWAIEWR